MPGNMSKEDAPGRSASLTFTIDSILNLKQRDRGELGSKGDGGLTEDFEARCEELWGVRRRRDSGAEDTGNCWTGTESTILQANDLKLAV